MPGDGAELARIGEQACVIFSLLILFGTAAAADEFDQRHKELLARRDLQFEFSSNEPAPQLASGSDWLADLLDAIAPLFSLLFWIAVGVAALALLWFIIRETLASRLGRDPRPKAVATVQETTYRPEPARAIALLEEADRLAGLGRFDEAARTLLHRSIEDIDQRIPQSIRKAQTSREIAGLPVLPKVVRDAFAPITRAVEQSWFGGYKLDADGFQVCRKAYADFALPESWSRAES
jgi:hypothetical protein